jgi:hypothetical protein
MTYTHQKTAETKNTRVSGVVEIGEKSEIQLVILKKLQAKLK